jgi:hypothetical protein
MIKADVFYQQFEAGLAVSMPPNLLRRSRGKLSKYSVDVGGDTVSLWFKVNGKASAINYQPGEFWPVIESKTLRDGPLDDGTVSWYQYTDAAMHTALSEQRRRVYDKTQNQTVFEYGFWRQLRDVWLQMARPSLDYEFAPGFPHTSLYYLDEADAQQWGLIFGEQLEPWLRRFKEQPETLRMHMGRVYWNQGRSQDTAQ